MEIERTTIYDYMEYFSTAAAMTQKDDVASAFLGNKFKFFSLSYLHTYFQFLQNYGIKSLCILFIQIKIHFCYVCYYYVENSLRIMLMPREQVP